MKNFHLNATAATLAVAVGLCTLATQDAGATNVPLVNPQFIDGVDGLNGWTTNLFPASPSGDTYVQTFTAPSPTFPTLGINGYVTMQCARNCPRNQTDTLSQQINGLTTGDSYQLTFYLAGQ